jgi:hypothetical protein
MSISESINRGYNLLVTSIVSLAGLAFLPEAFLEKDIPDKVDDTLLFVIGMLGIWWYNRGDNRFKHSIVPVVLVILAFDDAEAVGDDFGGLILFALAVGLAVYQYQKTKKLLS